MTQLVLPIRLADHAVFETFYPDGNEAAVAHLRSITAAAGGHGAWLWGPPASGKTHLLQAVCERAGDQAVYLSFEDPAIADPVLLDGLERRALVCLDDFDAVVGDPDWERAVFALFNAIVDTGGQAVVASVAAPRSCRFVLADLASRAASLPVFQLRALEEAARGPALKLRAKHRGLELPDETLRYLLTHSRRDMASLYRLLDRLDLAALRAQRKLTVPFVRDVIGAAE